MKNRQVPRAEWYPFFVDFNRRHQDDLAKLTVVGEKLGAQRTASGLEFEGIVADPFGQKLSIMLGGKTTANIEHPVARPVQVWVELDEDGEEIAVEINSEEGNKTILEFCAPARSRTASPPSSD